MRDHEAAKDLIRKLRAVRVEAGATPEEAMAAAERAREIAGKYGIDAASLDIEEGEVPGKWKRPRPRDILHIRIAEYAACELYSWHGGGAARRAVYVGLEHRVALAMWLHVMLERHIDTALVEYKRSRSYQRRGQGSRNAAAQAFEKGMVAELSRRLEALTRRDDLREARAALAPYMAERHPDLTTTTLSFPTFPNAGTRRLDLAALAGRAAGRAVEISAPVESDEATPPAMIGRR